MSNIGEVDDPQAVDSNLEHIDRPATAAAAVFIVKRPVAANRERSVACVSIYKMRRVAQRFQSAVVGVLVGAHYRVGLVRDGPVGHLSAEAARIIRIDEQ